MLRSRTNEDIIREREERLKGQRAQHQEEQRERIAQQSHAKEMAAKAKARARWIEAGGHPTDFEQSWKGIWRQLLIDAVVKGHSKSVLPPGVGL